MLLNSYTSINTKIDKSKTWLYKARKTLITREIQWTPYYTVASRYNKDNREYDYYIIMLRNKPEDNNCKRTVIDNYGRLKINIAPIYDITSLKDIKRDCNVNIRYIDEDDECIVYEIEV